MWTYHTTYVSIEGQKVTGDDEADDRQNNAQGEHTNAGVGHVTVTVRVRHAGQHVIMAARDGGSIWQAHQRQYK